MVATLRARGCVVQTAVSGQIVHIGIDICQCDIPNQRKINVSDGDIVQRGVLRNQVFVLLEETEKISQV